MTKKAAICVFLVLFCMASSTVADDIITVEVKNKFQAEVVSQIAISAHSRDLNTFTISVNHEQLKQLRKAGIEYETLVTDADVSSFYLIRAAACGPPTDLYKSLSTELAVGEGKSLMSLSRFEADNLSNSHDYMVNSIEELEIPIIYMSKTVVAALSEVTDFPTDEVIDLISQDSIYAFDSRLEAFQTRYIWTDSIDAARDWIAQKFTDWGYTDVTTPSLYYNGDYHYNVMAVKQGYAEPDKVIVIGGHYDSITYSQPTSPFDYAPGADDNGSGTVTTMELARIMAGYSYRKTIIFIAFTAEEVGLVGSNAAAADFYNSETDVEVMFNYDMVGYDPNNYSELEISSGQNQAYRNLNIDAVNRVTTLIPLADNSSPGSSDHASFDQWGFDISNNIEADFNYPGWHTNLDLTSQMNFPYLTEVVKSAAASIAYIANTAHPTTIEQLVDIGDGQSLEVFWSDCSPSYSYTLKYGTAPGVYDFEIVIPSGLCSYIISGLTEGQTYYFGVFGEIEDGYPALYTVEDSLAPLLYPRAPANVTADPDYQKILLNWSDNIEADFSHYRLHRSLNGLSYSLYADNLTSSFYEDQSVVGQINYFYKITAVDFDGNESDLSSEVNAFAATFDGGILIVDDMSQLNPMPEQTEQEAYFDSLFDTSPYGLTRIESNTADDRLSRNIAGQYSSVFWFDDDLSPKLIINSEDTLEWFLDYPNNIFVSGYSILNEWTMTPIPTSHLLFQDFGITSHANNPAMDFTGANGQSGFPNLVFDSDILFPNMPNVSRIGVRSGATVIYTFDSNTNDPSFENQPCGVMYDTPNGKRIFLTFPLYMMTTESAQQLISYVKTLFNEGGLIVTNGDINGDGQVTITDITFLVDYMFGGGIQPPSMTNTDVNNDCYVGIADLTYLVDYFFAGGPDPLAGCAK